MFCLYKNVLCTFRKLTFKHGLILLFKTQAYRQNHFVLFGYPRYDYFIKLYTQLQKKRENWLLLKCLNI